MRQKIYHFCLVFLFAAGLLACNDPVQPSRAYLPTENNEPAALEKAFQPAGSRPIINVEVEDGNTFLVPQPKVPTWSGDLWPQAWADDGYVYAANGDGFGFGWVIADMKVSRLVGAPPDLYGEPIPGAWGRRLGEIWSNEPPHYNRKPTGLICVKGVLYLFYQNLKDIRSDDPFTEAPTASVSWSDDHGRTWQWNPGAPLFADYQFTTGFFLDDGQCRQYARDEFVYVYGIDYNWRGTEDFRSTRLYLARVPEDAIPDRERWEFYAGRRLNGKPRWTADIAAKRPVLIDNADYHGYGGVSQGSVVFIPALRRYLYATWSWTAWIFWEAPEPWGPWTRVGVKSWGEREWDAAYHGGYPTIVPSKFLAADGLSGWIVSSINTTFDNYFYRYCMRRIRLETAGDE